MFVHVQMQGSGPHLPLPQLRHELDSARTADVLDMVDIGSFQTHKVFSQNNAEVLSALATAAYCTPADQQAHIRLQPGVRSFTTLDSADNASLGIHRPNTGTRVTVVETDNALLVAVRGTALPWGKGKDHEGAWKDLGSDANTVPVHNYEHDARVDGGFKRQADSIWDQLKPYLTRAVEQHKEIHLTGHSLGAAVAVELGDRMHEEMGVLPRSVLELGGPDIGWKGEKEHLEAIGLSDRIINVVNSGDPIPHSLPGGESVGHEVYLRHDGRADIKAGSHKAEGAETVALDVARGHAAILLYRHHPQFYVNGLGDQRNAKVLTQLEQELDP